MSPNVHAKGPWGMCAQMQTLEKRLLLSHGQVTWNIEGTDGPDTIVVQVKAGDPKLLQAVVNGVTSERAVEMTRYINISGGEGNDSISVKVGTSAEIQYVNVSGGAGDDTLS